jgi:hypothetical protein
MKLNPHPDYFDVASRPDYSRIQKASYGTYSQRLAIAERLYLDHKNPDCRALDNCFEMGDGDDIAAALVAKAMQNDDLKQAISRRTPANCLKDGFPESWLESYNRINNPLGLLA